VLYEGVDGRLLAFIHRRDQRYASLHATLAELRSTRSSTSDRPNLVELEGDSMVSERSERVT